MGQVFLATKGNQDQFATGTVTVAYSKSNLVQSMTIASLSFKPKGLLITRYPLKYYCNDGMVDIVFWDDRASFTLVDMPTSIKGWTAQYAGNTSYLHAGCPVTVTAKSGSVTVDLSGITHTFSGRVSPASHNFYFGYVGSNYSGTYTETYQFTVWG